MISYLIRRALGPSVGGFWVGLVMVLVGIALTVLSSAISAALGFQVTLVFYGLILFGVARMLAGIPALFSGRSASTDRSRPPAYLTSGPPLPSYYAPPTQTPPGYCWQCGGKVRPKATICLHCGATRAEEQSNPRNQRQSDPRQSNGPAMDAPYYPPSYPANYPPNGPRPVTHGPNYAPNGPNGNRGGYVPNRAATYGPQPRRQGDAW